MKDYKELIERLADCATDCHDLLLEATDEIERLNEKLEEEWNEHDFLMSVIDVERKEHKEALEAERKKHEWVSVKDRLPETNDNILVVCVNEKGDEKYTDIGWFNYRANIWHATGDVTHWMPLPEPPKEEE